jgi:hypothetical protein
MADYAAAPLFRYGPIICFGLATIQIIARVGVVEGQGQVPRELLAADWRRWPCAERLFRLGGGRGSGGVGPFLDAAVHAVGDEEVLPPVEGQAVGDPKLPRPDSPGTEAAQQAALGVEAKDFVAAYVGDIDGVIGPYRQAGEGFEFSSLLVVFSPGEEEFTLGVEFLEAIIEAVEDIDIIGAVHGDGIGAIDFPRTPAYFPPLFDEAHGGIEFLDAAVFPVHQIDIPFGVESHCHGVGELPGPPAEFSVLPEQFSARGKYLESLIFHIHYPEAALGVDLQIMGIIQFPGFRPRAAETAEQFSRRGEALHPRQFLIEHIEVVFGVEGDAPGPTECSRGGAQVTPGSQKTGGRALPQASGQQHGYALFGDFLVVLGKQGNLPPGKRH